MRVALLHGFAQTPASWAEVLAALPADLDLRPTALPGHDPALPVAATWDETVDRLAERVGEVDVVVGYSLGARLALGLLARARVPAALLVGCNPGLAADDVAARAERRAADAAWAARLRRDGTAAFLAAWEAQPLFATQVRAPTAVRARRRQERAALDPGGLAAALEVLGLGAMPDLRPALVARAGRARLVVGADDARFLAIARTLAHASPELRCDVVDGSGHDPTLEAPRALADVIARTLGQRSG